MPVKALLDKAGSRIVIGGIAAYLLLALLFIFVIVNVVTSVITENLERRVIWHFDRMSEVIVDQPPEAALKTIQARMETTAFELEVMSLSHNGQILATTYPFDIPAGEGFIHLPDFTPEFENESEHEHEEFEEDEGGFDPMAISGLSALIPSPDHTEGYLAHVEQVGPYRLMFGTSLDTLDEARDAALFLALLFVPLSLLLFALAAWGVNRIIRRRVTIMNQQIENIERSGKLSLRIPNSNPRDEYGQLTGHINAMLDKIDGSVTQIKGVADDIAHDLRTPLTRLQYGFQTALNDEERTQESLETALENGLVETDKLLDTFGSILRISQIETGHQTRQFKPFDLSAAIQSLVDIYEPSADTLGHTLRSDITSDIVLTGDVGMIQQVVANLIENCFEHGGDTLTINVVVTQKKNQIVLSVCDNGKGIEDNEADFLFEKFFRGEASRKDGGNGLGLSLVKAISTLHKADVTIFPCSQTNGTCVVLTFPV